MNDKTSNKHYVYFFGQGQADGGSAIKHLVGGKGASLADMTKAQLNVPPGFTISAECCDLYFKNDKRWPAGLEEEIRVNLARLERLAGKTFGQGADPLLVAVRSGAAQSMPGMMDTVLNIGLNPDSVRTIGERTNPRGAWQVYYHFLTMYGHTVGGLQEEILAGSLRDLLKETNLPNEDALQAEHLSTLCQRLSSLYRSHTGKDLPTEPWPMLVEAINAVFLSWNQERAVTYRQHHGIEGLLGTAVNVQMMCPAETSGVMFTANPVNTELPQIIIESSFGLGEAIVLTKIR